MKRKLLIVSLICGCGEKMLDPLDPNAFPQYSGIATIETGQQTNSFAYYRDGNRVRIVPQIPVGTASDQSLSFLIDLEAKTSTAIVPQVKQYYVRPLGGTTTGPHWLIGQGIQPPSVLSREDLGTDTVSGHSCNVQRVTIQSTDGKQHVMKLWSARDLHGFPIRIDASEGAAPIRMTFNDVSLSPPKDSSLLAVPADFKPMGNRYGGPAQPLSVRGGKAASAQSFLSVGKH